MEITYRKQKTALLSLFRKPPFSPSVYLITSLATGHRYVGSSINPPIRFLLHKLDMFWGKHSNYRLQRDYDLHGESNFLMTILWSGVCTRGNLYRLEQQAINQLKPEYNIRKFTQPKKRKSPVSRKTRGKSRVKKSHSKIPKRVR